MPFGMRNVWHGERHAKLQNGKNAVFLPLWPDRGEESHDRTPRKPVFQGFFRAPHRRLSLRARARLWTGASTAIYYRASFNR